MDFIEGEILHIDKPLHWTSFRLVRVVRAKLCGKLRIKKLKVGHAGTLDPLATGVMTICTGKKTKEIERLQAQTKEYVAQMRLGATTPSFDLETEIDAEYPTNHITRDKVEACLRNFIGEIEQVPPVFSAVKVQGKRAYEFARKNENIELKPKMLVIDDIELISYNLPTITIRVLCSKGTYIRALARDIGQCLQSGAHLTALERTRVGDISLKDCMKVEELDEFFNSEIVN
ncbi:MAG: tRNA pseudouridine(55) synthase TruB [Bacteroidia bacterium]|nr:tRNA pseudouridine(55) synthase TruB [Bacteroidia bacterium]